MKSIIRIILTLGIVFCFLVCAFTAIAERGKHEIDVQNLETGEKGVVLPGDIATMRGGSLRITEDFQEECCDETVKTAREIDPKNEISGGKGGGADDDADDDDDDKSGGDDDDDLDDDADDDEDDIKDYIIPPEPTNSGE